MTTTSLNLSLGTIVLLKLHITKYLLSLDHFNWSTRLLAIPVLKIIVLINMQPFVEST